MSQEQSAEELVEEGLKLYSKGSLDDALEKWRAALALASDVPRANEYIQYVEENRVALEESFRGAEPDKPAQAESAAAASASSAPDEAAPQEDEKSLRVVVGALEDVDWDEARPATADAVPAVRAAALRRAAVDVDDDEPTKSRELVALAAAAAAPRATPAREGDVDDDEPTHARDLASAAARAAAEAAVAQPSLDKLDIDPPLHDAEEDTGAETRTHGPDGVVGAAGDDDETQVRGQRASQAYTRGNPAASRSSDVNPRVASAALDQSVAIARAGASSSPSLEQPERPSDEDTSKILLDDYELARAEAKQGTADVPIVKAADARPPLKVVDRPARSDKRRARDSQEATAFDPLEPTPVREQLPEPSRLLTARDAESAERASARRERASARPARSVADEASAEQELADPQRTPARLGDISGGLRVPRSTSETFLGVASSNGILPPVQAEDPPPLDPPDAVAVERYPTPSPQEDAAGLFPAGDRDGDASAKPREEGVAAARAGTAPLEELRREPSPLDVLAASSSRREAPFSVGDPPPLPGDASMPEIGVDAAAPDDDALKASLAAFAAASETDNPVVSAIASVDSEFAASPATGLDQLADAADMFARQGTLTPAEGEERVDSMLAGAWQLHEQGTYEGSLWLCQRILGIEADNAEAKGLLERNRDRLLEQYQKQLSDLEVVPVVQVPQHEIVWHKLDHRAGFLLSRIDGLLSYSDILDICGMSRFEACRILAQLLEQGVIAAQR